MKSKYFLLFILLFFPILFTTSCSKDTTNQEREITFVLDWTPNTNHTGFYVADKMGYFEEQGIKINVVQPSDGDAPAIVATKKAEFGIGYQDNLASAFALENPLPITSIATIIQHNGSGIVSLKSSGIDSPKEMENKTYASLENPTEQGIIKHIVETDGGDFSKVNIITNNIVDEPSALKSKDVDCIWIFKGWGGIAMDVFDVETNYFMIKDIDPVLDYYTPVIIANNEFLQEEPELTKKFLIAVKKGYEYSIENPEEAGNILLEAVPELDKDLVIKSQIYLSNEYKSEVTKWGYIDPVRWNNFYNWLNDNNILELKLPENTGFTNEYLPEN